MIVIVQGVVRFEVDVEAPSVEAARRAVEANWDSLYKHRALWYRGLAPALTATDIRVVTQQLPVDTRPA